MLITVSRLQKENDHLRGEGIGRRERRQLFHEKYIPDGRQLVFYYNSSQIEQI